MATGLVMLGLFGLVAFVAFAVGRQTERVNREHERALARLLHPTGAGASVIDQAPGESVRLVSEAPFDWSDEEESS